MRIEILSVTVNTVPTKTGSYRMAELAYKADGKVQGRKVPDFVCKEGFDLFQVGALLDIQMAKEMGRDGKEYWQWLSAKKADGPLETAATKAGTPAPRSTYETPEERAKRQEYIIRQSSLSNAISLLKTDKIIPSVGEVFSVADQFVDYVNKKSPPVFNEDVMLDLNDDIPY